ncbi:MAG: CRISPR system precrRNA processing endoribonuclease RAMP protein Cas6, partial [Desulfobacterales bacterium]|nr:CRISPR system precrRNA processing endoribonuclease RAMP protein Cas6 [Desulfobacterales bacterium]
DKCVYSFVFENAFIHPYVIEPPDTPATNYSKRDEFSFNLLLFGKANDYLPYFIYAFDMIGKTGIGKRVSGRAGTFKLESVFSGDQPVYSSTDGKMRQHDFAHELSLSDFRVKGSNSLNSVEISLKTPLRLKYLNHLESALPFHVLVRAMLRRISSLENSYGDGEPDINYRELVKIAETVTTSASSLGWFDWKRYSGRQEQSMLMGGITGNVTYSGEIAEFLPLIKFCEMAHLGKQTTFGLGKIEITGVQPDAD